MTKRHDRSSKIVFGYYPDIDDRDSDVDQPTNTSKDPLHVSNGLMTRSKTKALNALVLKVSTKSNLKGLLECQEEALVHLIHV